MDPRYMDSPYKNYYFTAGEQELHVPFVVNVDKMPIGAISDLMDGLADKLGARYFREKDLTMEVLDDQIARASQPYKFLYGPYVGVFIKDNGEVRITTSEHVKGGETVYALDQIKALLDAVEGPLNVENHVRRRTPRP